MRVQYFALVVAAALAASANGLHSLPDSAKSSLLQTTDKRMHQSVVEDKTDRRLNSLGEDLPLMVASTGLASPSLLEGGRHLRSEDSPDVVPEDESRGLFKRLKKNSLFGWLHKKSKKRREKRRKRFERRKRGY